MLRGDVTGEVPRDPDDPYVRAIAPGRATAPLVGGCLWLLLQTLGTPWELETDGTILFFEDTHAPPYYVDGQLTQLRHAGKLDGLAGVVVGEMNKLRLRRPAARRQRLARRRSRSRTCSTSTCSRSACPFSTSCRSGTASTWLPFRSGVRYTLDADARTLTVDESPFEG